jgi:hypothetical protein
LHLEFVHEPVFTAGPQEDGVRGPEGILVALAEPLR